VLTGRRVIFSELGNIEALFALQMLVPFLGSIGDQYYYPQLISEFYANMTISHDLLQSYLVGIDLTFDDTLIGQLLKIPSSGVDITLTIYDLNWSYLEINKAISINTNIIAANIVQKKGHFDELSELTCKAVYAITKKIQVNWARVIVHCMTHVKTKLFFGSLLTYLFEHFDVPFDNEARMVVKSKPLGSSAIEKMEQALERSKISKSMPPSTSSAPPEVHESESSDEDDEGSTAKQIESLQKQLDDIKFRQEQHHIVVNNKLDLLLSRFEASTQAHDTKLAAYQEQLEEYHADLWFLIFSF